MAYKFKLVALGGTFDLLHKGHEALLTKAFSTSQKVTIGITSDNFCKQSGKPPLEKQNIRRKNIQAFLSKQKLSKRAEIVNLSDIYGPTLKDQSINALVISKETLPNAKLINKERKKRKLKNLWTVIVPTVFADDKKIISSSRIRNGQISSSGRNYQYMLLKISGKSISETARAKLKTPFGKITRAEPKKSAQKIIAVGDITVQTFLKNKITPDVSIVDFMVKRKKVFNTLFDLGFPSGNADTIVKNPPGVITKNLINEVQKSILQNSHKTIIVVNGEEDLAAVPAILLSPLGYQVFYGQPNRGMVKIEVDTRVKDRLLQALNL